MATNVTYDAATTAQPWTIAASNAAPHLRNLKRVLLGLPASVDLVDEEQWADAAKHTISSSACTAAFNS